MKIFSAAQIRAWDQYTLENEPIDSLGLMERAALAFADWFAQTYPDPKRPVAIFCGPGNNGGDGLAVARLLSRRFYAVKVVLCTFGARQSADFAAQRAALPLDALDLAVLDAEAPLPVLPPDTILVDALFGTGLNRPLEGAWAGLVAQINRLPLEKVAIDLPSGLLADAHTPPTAAVLEVARTFGFQLPKLAFFFPENAGRVGDWAVGDIGLHPGFYAQTDSREHFLAVDALRGIWKKRGKFAHKGNFGHALLWAGSLGKMGAATLATRACLRAGAGLLTLHGPRCGLGVAQVSVPEAMYSPDAMQDFCGQVPDLSPYAAVGAGPGLGTAAETARAFEALLRRAKGPMVLDADALNLLAARPTLWPLVPENSLLTPHAREFERLFGKTGNDFQRFDLQRDMAQKHRVNLLLKGAHSCVAAPDGRCWFNTTGNPGMATGGAGDVLTGLLTGLLAQGYAPTDALRLGVWLHGLAGDLAAAEVGQNGLLAGDLVECLPRAMAVLG
jgi:NAD(P)H-hydrate epimerase